MYVYVHVRAYVLHRALNPSSRFTISFLACGVRNGPTRDTFRISTNKRSKISNDNNTNSITMLIIMMLIIIKIVVVVVVVVVVEAEVVVAVTVVVVVAAVVVVGIVIISAVVMKIVHTNIYTYIYI